MEPGVFYRKLKRLNRKLHVCCLDGPRAAGLEILEGDEMVPICAVDKNAVPEHTEYDKVTGFRMRSGWRRVLRILIQRRLVDRRRAERLFNTHLGYASFTKFQMEEDPITRALKEARLNGEREAIKKYGKPVKDYMRWQDLVDIHRMRKPKGEHDEH